jgi:hypothetical protein
MKLIKYYILFLGFLSISLFGIAQSNSIFRSETNPTSRLIFYEFGMVDFNINSFYKYQNGVELTTFHTIAVSYVDTISDTNWKLEIKAVPSYISSDGSNPNLDLQTIEILVENGAGGNLNISSYINDPGDGDNDFDLQGTYIEVISNVPECSFDDYRIDITYRCGQGSESLMQKAAGYYTVDIFYRVSPDL